MPGGIVYFTRPFPLLFWGMLTHHSILTGDSREIELPSEKFHLVVTSPPYPMISMWDELFMKMDSSIRDSLPIDPNLAFEKMHRILDTVWQKIYPAVVPGGIIAINVGDAVRTIDGRFQLFPNHTRIVQSMHQAGFISLPPLIWRKQTNAPNKFMGSGMLPGGAYVTYEHEYILIFRKGDKRQFSSEQKKIRQESAYFWMERNVWFSDLWDFKGVRQNLDSDARKRNGSFPLELPHRLIQMYSIYGDHVLDPFSGLGTTTLAAMVSGRNSMGIEMEKDLAANVFQESTVIKASKYQIQNRLQKYLDFIQTETGKKREFKHHNLFYGFPVVTNQEKNLKFYVVDSLEGKNGEYTVSHSPYIMPDTHSELDLTTNQMVRIQ